ncbi:hypothetical protein PG614_09295 [Riemerella anatipestifer]|nr:hypothetical protein [Riemerella anatipestifer]MDY3533925.1 hypothetical protein [Riemerella anatipestifer]MDY3536139.1 hypothetical protein [Riemerella anatipestifer]
MKILKEENEKKGFVAKLKDTKAVPVWDKVIIDKVPKNMGLGVFGDSDNIVNSEQRIIIPLTQDGFFMSSYIVASINRNNEITYLENMDNSTLYGMVYNKSISKDIRENIMANIIFINNRAFGFKKFINVPGDLFSDIPLDSTKTTKTIKLVEDDSNKSITPNSMLELMCLIYEIDDPNCSCHGTITSTKCFYIYVGGGGGASSGEGGGGEGGKPESGDSGGSGVSSNTPWYLMNPNINIYSYNTYPRAVFKAMTDYGIVLQKEHMDYMQSHPDVTNSILENLEYSNGHKAVFFYNFLREIWYKNPKPNSGILVNKFNSFYDKLFEINPTTTWFDFQNILLPYEDTNHSILSELLNDWNNPNIVKPTLRFKQNIRLNCIFNKVKKISNFRQYLRNFDGRFSTAHLLLDLKPLSDTNANAQTSPPIGYWIKIDINSNNLDRPTLDIARTFMHEMIHAEMFRILLSLASSNGQIDVVKLKNMLSTHNYSGIYDYYRRFGLNNMQHEQMAAHYRGIIKNFLKQIDNSITDSQAEAIAWVGLQGTTAWNNLGATNQLNVQNTYNNWYNSASRSCP